MAWVEGDRMELIRGMHNLAGRHRGCVATLGNFDGVHLGHRTILSQLARLGRDLGLASTLVTFEPPPQEFFAGPKARPRLTRFREKMLALDATPVDRVIVLRFDETLSRVPAGTFIEQFLVSRLGVKLVVAGDDFRFGQGARGNLALLEEYGTRHDYAVVRHETYMVGGARVSSSRVREALASGDLGLAEKLLGRSYFMCGRVGRGNRLGSRIGYPTANVMPRRRACALAGIFVVSVGGVGARALPGVASIGTRPTVGGKQVVLEAHVFDFDGDLYGKHIRVNFLEKLRDEQHFGSVEAMTRQIARDAAQARAFFHAAPESANAGGGV